MEGPGPGGAQPVLAEQSGARRLLRGGPVRLVGYAVSLGLSLASVSISLRYLGTDSAGALFAGTSALTVAAAFSDLGILNASLRDYATADQQQRARQLRTAATLRSATLALACLPAVIIAASVVEPNAGYVLGLLIGSLGLMISVLLGVATVPVAERIDTTTQALVQVAQGVGVFLATGMLVLAHASMPWFFATQLVGGLVGFAALKWRSRGERLALPSPSLLRDASRLITREGLILGAAVCLYVAFFRLGPLLTVTLAGSSEAGLYGAAFRIADVLESAAPLLMAVALPLLARGALANGAIRRQVRASLIVAASAGTVVAAATFAGAPIAIALVGGPQFEGAVVPLQVMSLMVLLGYPTQVFGYALLADRRHTSMLVTVAVTLVLYLIVAGLLVPRGGATGAAIALAVGQLSLLVGYLVEHGRKHGFTGLVWPNALAIGAFTLGVGASMLLSSPVLATAVATVIAAAVMAAPAYRAVKRSLARSDVA